MIIKLKEGFGQWNHFGFIRPKLGMIFYDFVYQLEALGIEEVTITSIIRPAMSDSGIHQACRAIDIRADFSYDNIGSVVMDYINNKYPYDLNRPNMKTVIYHETDDYNDAAMHYHVQVNYL